MKSKVFKAIHRFIKARRRKFVLWLREVLLDFEDRHKETKLGNCILRRYLDVKIGKNTIIDSHLQVGDNVVIGNSVLIRENCFIDSNVVIEDEVTLSPGVRLITAGHNPKDMSYVSAPIVIHKRAWIATNAINIIRCRCRRMCVCCRGGCCSQGGYLLIQSQQEYLPKL